MLKNLQEIHHHISKKEYADHSGVSPELCHRHVNASGCIKSSVIENGFLILNFRGTPLLSIMRLLKQSFGQPMRNSGYPKKYIVRIAPQQNGNFYFNSHAAQPTHTDCGHQSGFPGFIALYCLRAAPTGGVNIIVKVSDVLKKLQAEYQQDMTRFFDPGFIQIETAYETLYKQILFYLDDKTTGMSYSPILKNILTTELGQRMIASVNQIIHDPANQYRVKLNPYDLLIIDNCQVLHGRTAFNKNDDRLLLRMWNGQRSAGTHTPVF